MAEKYLKDKLRDLELQERLQSMMTDNAPDIVRGLDLLEGSPRRMFPDAYADHHCFHIRCFAYFIHLTVKDYMKTIHVKIKHIRKFIGTICSSVKRKH